MSTILCSGAAGFIGSSLCDKLIELGHFVVGVDDLSAGFIININKNITFFQRNISENLSDIFEKYKPEYVFNLAAKIDLRHSISHPRENAYTNIDGSLNLIELAIKHKVKKFIFASTGGAIYDKQAPLPWVEESLSSSSGSPVGPASPYGLSKLTIENYLKLMKTLYGLDWVALRFGNVFGPRQHSGECGVLSIFINNILNNKDLNVFGNGTKTRDYIFVQDVCSAMVLAMKDDVNGIFNVGSNEQHSLLDIIDMLKIKFNKDIQVNYKPDVVGEIEHTRLSYDKLNKLTGWRPEVSFSDGLDKTIEYFKVF